MVLNQNYFVVNSRSRIIPVCESVEFWFWVIGLPTIYPINYVTTATGEVFFLLPAKADTNKEGAKAFSGLPSITPRPLISYNFHRQVFLN